MSSHFAMIFGEKVLKRLRMHMRSSFSALIAVLILVATGSHCSAVPLKTFIPQWLHGKENLLPPIKPEEIEIMRSAWDEIDPMEIGFTNKNPSHETLDAAKKVLALGKKAGLAMVWLYIEAPPVSDDLDWLKVGQEKGLILSEIKNDPSLVEWMLPLLRVRIAWLRNHLNDDDFLQEKTSLGDISGIGVYLNIQGSEADLNELWRLHEEVEAQRLRIMGGPVRGELPPPSREALTDWGKHLREVAQSEFKPFHNEFSWAKKFIGASETSGNPTNGSLSTPNHDQAPFKNNQTPSVSYNLSRFWLVWLVVVTVTLGSAWLFFCKRK